MKKTLLSVTVGLALLAPALASAQAPDEYNNYIAGKFGPYFPTATNPFTAIGGSSPSNWTTQWEADLMLGHWWGYFGLEFNAGYLTTGGADTSFKGWPVLAVAKIRLPFGFIAPYGEGGAGININSLSVSGVGGATETHSTTSFQGIVGAGVDFYLGQLLLGADFKYIWINPSYNFSGTSNFSFNGITVQAYVGYRF
jgi:hypothetical protein